jgi:hypothetical protein
VGQQTCQSRIASLRLRRTSNSTIASSRPALTARFRPKQPGTRDRRSTGKAHCRCSRTRRWETNRFSAPRARIAAPRRSRWPNASMSEGPAGCRHLIAVYGRPRPPSWRRVWREGFRYSTAAPYLVSLERPPQLVTPVTLKARAQGLPNPSRRQQPRLGPPSPAVGRYSPFPVTATVRAAAGLQQSVEAAPAVSITGASSSKGANCLREA